MYLLLMVIWSKTPNLISTYGLFGGTTEKEARSCIDEFLRCYQGSRKIIWGQILQQAGCPKCLKFSFLEGYDANRGVWCREARIPLGPVADGEGP